MSIAKQIERITNLAKADKSMAQLELDIALRSAASSRAANALKQAGAALGLVTVVQFL